MKSKFLILNLFLCFSVQAQDNLDCITWQFYYTELKVNEFRISIKASLKDGCKIADDQLNPDTMLALPINIEFKETKHITFIETINEIAPEYIYNETCTLYLVNNYMN